MTELIKYPDPEQDFQGFMNSFINKGLTEQQATYILICERKNALFTKLQNKELEAQDILNKLPSDKIAEIEEGLKKYRAVFAEMSDNIRSPFTSFLKVNLTEPAMAFEARVDPATNLKYKEISQKLTNLKIADQTRIAELAKKNEEKNRYLAHIKNENTKRVSEYKQKVLTEINTMYQTWLKGEIENPDIATLKEAVKSIQVCDPAVMQRLYVNDTEAQAYYAEWLVSKEVFEINQDELYEESLKLVDEKFTTYLNDLELTKKQPEIITEIEKHNQEELNSVIDTALIETSVNNLVSTSQSVASFTPEYKKLKESYTIDFINEKSFAIKVMSAFIQNPILDTFLRVKEWKNLKIEQMLKTIADYASSDNGKQIEGFVYKKVTL